MYANETGLTLFLDAPTQPFSPGDDWKWIPSGEGYDPWLGYLKKQNMNLPVASIKSLTKE
jgi:hypothetical protein